MKKLYFKWIIVGLVSFLLLAGAGLFLFRGALLRSVASGKIDAFARKYDLQIAYESLSMPSVSSVQLDGLTLVPTGRDTLLTIKELEVDLGMFHLLGGKVSVRGVRADGMRLTFVKEDTESNYDFLFQKRESRSDREVVREGSYAERAERIFGMLFRLLPQDARLTELCVEGRRDSLTTSFFIPEILLEDGRFNANVQVTEADLRNDWQVQGCLDDKHHVLEGRITSPQRVVLPYIRTHYHTFVGFDSVSFSLSEHSEGGELVLDGHSSVKGLEVFHSALSPDTIDLDKGGLEYKLRVGGNYAELDSASSVVFNQLDFHPYLRASKNGRWHFTASVQKDAFPAQHLFASLPAGLFHHLQGIQTEGKLGYDFLLDVDFNQLDSLKFHSDLEGYGFHIRSLGGSNLAKMSGEFEYTAYDGDRPVRTFLVGSSNPSFRSLEAISPLLQEAIMQSEDGHFYYHQGFYPGAIQEALAYDLGVGRFARGGSSITMQLVKNVFLNKHKNIARKLEEALIVWLIENQHLTSKHRMYEVYLNIAEWGPMVYGAAEAAHFYFDKEPSDLTLSEAVFMASVIPRPKHFYWSFAPDGTLREGQVNYFRQIARRLAVKGLITDEQAETFLPDVDLKGTAKSLVIKPDTLAVSYKSTQTSTGQ